MERPIYRLPRLATISRLDLAADDRVLDVGCGTGLNFAPVLSAVGPGGSLVGLDASGPMLARARSRVLRRDWANAELVIGDAGRLAEVLADNSYFDAILFTYSLSIIDQWEAAWAQAWALLRPGGRAAVLDLALPSGRGGWLRPLARLACFTGGSDPQRAPWRRVVADADDVREISFRAGHIHLAVGRKPGRAPASGAPE